MTTYYVNMYPDGTGGTFYSRVMADTVAGNKRIALVVVHMKPSDERTQQPRWKDKIDEFKSKFGRGITLTEALRLAQVHVMTEAEIEEQAQSWSRQMKD